MTGPNAGDPPEPARWAETDSARFRQLGDLFVPARELQADILAEQVPVGKEPLTIVDLGCGDGYVSAAILRRWAGASLLAVDGSPSMLAAARVRCREWADRFAVRRADLEHVAAEGLPGRPMAAVSSLAVHHLLDDDKRRLFAAVASSLAPGGALLLADVYWPTTATARARAARQWDEAVAERCNAAGCPEILEVFRAEGWNMFALPQPDPEDHPAPLADQLRWLEEAGLRDVDVYWASAGHAVFGGRRG